MLLLQCGSCIFGAALQGVHYFWFGRVLTPGQFVGCAINLLAPGSIGYVVVPKSYVPEDVGNAAHVFCGEVLEASSGNFFRKGC
ncbi:MAG TPA: hypothetical protein VFP59_17435 [Candidatus Angelobacter sp.]|nr:hypothetical protein [Candidatus Angelobacter sp.]